MNITHFLVLVFACATVMLNLIVVSRAGTACTNRNPEDHRYIILLKKNQSSEQFEAYLAGRIQTYNHSGNECFQNSFETLADMKDTHIYLARIDEQIVAELKRRPDVESVEKDGIVTATNPSPTGNV
ncbi:hypothetical protein K493DRAFT_313150 [Basidiobolus meristosporus CBS 931.73]|uniref:Inhibitor I9 domain-containing protein n=1 Tax=Basidiobolus meristosporus CBS 931.73 TaxID=1314790 RepID=A0A1Y1YNP8_9FUNG|nr:hypothetical protein K493DRAFT_313150 [Basidiobolus meristosporus CBS 931.73]|eukprot:ORX99660.1 hypothetical protein K493DRAFT_313150 [Basidiobolus meristosporus CBS 931.73]